MGRQGAWIAHGGLRRRRRHMHGPCAVHQTFHTLLSWHLLLPYAAARHSALSSPSTALSLLMGVISGELNQGYLRSRQNERNAPSCWLQRRGRNASYQ